MSWTPRLRSCACAQGVLKEVIPTIIIEDKLEVKEDLVAAVADVLKVEVYQVFYLAAQDEGLGHAHEIAVHRTKEYHEKGYVCAPDYVKEFCKTMQRALRRVVHTA